jgi:metal-dependent hydrolase (beta-lactamase superfamily II)
VPADNDRAPAVFAPCDCTGLRAAVVFKRTLPESLLSLGSGAVVE